MRISINAAPQGESIKSMAAGTFFNFPVSAKGNEGVCVRLKDSKVGKNRFANLGTGKVLTAVDDRIDRGKVLEAGTTLTLG